MIGSASISSAQVTVWSWCLPRLAGTCKFVTVAVIALMLFTCYLSLAVPYTSTQHKLVLAAGSVSRRTVCSRGLLMVRGLLWRSGGLLWRSGELFVGEEGNQDVHTWQVIWQTFCSSP